MQKQVQFKIKGMQRDLSASAFNPEYAYENKNVRIMPTDESTLLSIINEKGNKKSNISGVGDYIDGTPIGQAVINNELIVFSYGEKTELPETTIEAEESTITDIVAEESNIEIETTPLDRIYKLWFDNGNLTGKLLYKGDLGFDYKHPIESISFYENSDIRKIYWTDGLNQPRVINVAAASAVVNKWKDDSFNFVRTLKLKEKVSIDRNLVANGSFAPGVIQYVFTYFDKYSQETNIFYASPLYYISYNNRGASPEDSVSNSFNISIVNPDNSFDYIRVYSIHRSSINATPTVKRVVDLAIPTSGTYTYKTTSLSFVDNPYTITLYKRSDGSSLKLSEVDTSSYILLSGDTYSKITFSNGNSISLTSGKTFILTFSDGYKGTANYNDNSEFSYTSTVTKSVTYTDNGLSGDSIDPTELLYVGGEEVVFGTMSQKDNTLFLGDFTLQRKTIDSSIKNFFRRKTITFSTYVKSITPPEPSGYYPYNNQLKLNSYQFKTFKYLEYYRFGIQAQHYTGKWSEPIWINDVRNTTHIDTTFYNSGSIGLPVAEYTLSDSSIIDKLLAQGYIRIRPVVVYPSINDREAVCQGVLCPTVYNVSDRYGNSPFAQSSWFTRPNAPFDYNKAFAYNQGSDGKWYGDWISLGQFIGDPSIYSRAGIMTDNRTKVTLASTGETFDLDVVNKGSWAEFRHNRPIPSNDKRGAEIQCIYNPQDRPVLATSTSDSDVIGWVSQNSENFYVDQSIVTLHSPDIEFDNEVRSLDTSGLKLRIVGIVPVTAFASDIDIQTSTPINNFYDSSDFPIGFYKEPIGVENNFTEDYYRGYGESHFGWRCMMSGAFWFDEVTGYKKDTGNTNHYTTGFVVYPFHRNGSLNNTKFATDGYRSAMLDKKKLSNLRYSYKTQYIDSNYVWNAYVNNHSSRTGISGVAIFDSNEVSLVRLPAQENSGLTDINYYGNIDKILNVSRVGDKKDGYPIMTTGVQNADTNAHLLFSGNYTQVDSRFTDQITGIDPVRMKYKSTPHAVLALNYSTDKRQRVLPTLKDSDPAYPGTNEWSINSANMEYASQFFFWDKSKSLNKTSQDVLNIGIGGNISSIGSLSHGWLWLGELYNDNVQNRFGGQTEEAFENNIWLPCGDPISIYDEFGVRRESITVRWVEGDTYYQRYDHLKTYPFTLEDQNAITDIISIMCETRVNIDGRYDRNRGQTSNFAITPENFNLMNDVYSQPNNFFNYRTINPNKLNLDNFYNSITWTKTKTAGELVYTWTNITLASILDLDGDKGNVRALRRFNNNLLAFQDRGISQILYNENMQITSTEGVPIEIANSGKVNGKRYITDRVGCTNKWSMCETPNGIYFIDDITKGIFLFNGKLDNISDRLGFHSWINKSSKNVSIWNPVDFDSFVTYYDKVNGDVFFISRDECLAFSEPMGQFTSFYSYEKMPYFSNLEDRGISLNVEGTDSLYKAWLHNEGDYNMYFGVYHPFYTTIIANPEMSKDKVFNNLEFRADTWDKNNTLLNTTFDTLTTWNEYQEGTASLTNVLGRPSDLKRKFRIWRANIPRAKVNGRDRMRNPWLYIKLSMEGENTNKTLLHDMIVHYFE